MINLHLVNNYVLYVITVSLKCGCCWMMKSLYYSFQALDILWL